ncbi:MAG: hypothetical protein LE168_01700 [Endomicrobium sp.]|nr:hypothetical protein [Endomicrobium sp.]
MIIRITHPIDTSSYHGTFFTNPPQPAAPLPYPRPSGKITRADLYKFDDHRRLIDNLRLPKNIAEAGMEIRAILNERDLINALIKENHADRALLRELKWHNYKRLFLLEDATKDVENGFKNGKLFARRGYEGYDYYEV